MRPHPHLHPPPHPHHHAGSDELHRHPHQGHHSHELMYWASDDLAREEVVRLIRKLSRPISENTGVTLGNVEVSLPPTVYALVGYKRARAGELEIAIELKWNVPSPLPRPPAHGPRWLYRSEGEISREQSGELLGRIADDIDGRNGVEMGGRLVDVPETVHTVVRYERPPRGELVLRVELRWRDDGDAGAVGSLADFLNN